MEVCKECHEKDRQVTKCDIPLSKHFKWSRGFVGHCAVCGKSVEATYYCVHYKRLSGEDMAMGGIKCLSAKNAMNKID